MEAPYIPEAKDPDQQSSDMDGDVEGFASDFLWLDVNEITFRMCYDKVWLRMAANCKTNGDDMFYVKIIFAIASALLC